MITVLKRRGTNRQEKKRLRAPILARYHVAEMNRLFTQIQQTPGWSLPHILRAEIEIQQHNLLTHKQTARAANKRGKKKGLEESKIEIKTGEYCSGAIMRLQQLASEEIQRDSLCKQKNWSLLIRLTERQLAEFKGSIREAEEEFGANTRQPKIEKLAEAATEMDLVKAKVQLLVEMPKDKQPPQAKEYFEAADKKFKRLAGKVQKLLRELGYKK